MKKYQHKLRSWQKGRSGGSQGFTIIELLIATVIFSLLLLVCAASVMFITRSYVKGEVGIQTEDAARSIITLMTQDIEFSSYSTIASQVSSQPPNNSDNFALCLGSHVYFYTLDEELQAGSTNIGETTMYSPHDLFVGQYSGTCPGSVSTASCPLTLGITRTCLHQMNDSPTGFYSSAYQELLSQHMRLGQLYVQQLTDGFGNKRNAFKISVEVAYGDDDVLTDNAPLFFGGTHYNHPRKPPAGSAWNTPGVTFPYSCVPSNFGGQFCSVSTLTAIVSSRIN